MSGSDPQEGSGDRIIAVVLRNVSRRVDDVISVRAEPGAVRAPAK